MGVSRGDFNPPHRVAGPSAAPPHAAAYLAAQPDPKPHPRPVKPEGDGLPRAPLLEELVALMLPARPARGGLGMARDGRRDGVVGMARVVVESWSRRTRAGPHVPSHR